MTEVLDVLILSGHMTREHDNEHRSFRQHNQWLTTLLEDTGRFRVRVVEDPRGLGAEIIDKYDVVIVVFEGRDGYHDKAIGFGAETDAALLRFVHDDGKGFDPAQQARSHGMGLELMRERVTELGGSFTLDSAPGQGTTLSLIHI